MALLEVINTEMQVMSPLYNNMEAAFGQAALKLLEKGDRKSLEKLMKLYGRARDVVQELDELVKVKKS